MDSIKDLLIKLIDSLNDKQIEFLYYFVKKSFGHTVD